MHGWLETSGFAGRWGEYTVGHPGSTQPAGRLLWYSEGLTAAKASGSFFGSAIDFSKGLRRAPEEAAQTIKWSLLLICVM